MSRGLLGQSWGEGFRCAGLRAIEHHHLLLLERGREVRDRGRGEMADRAGSSEVHVHCIYMYGQTHINCLQVITCTLKKRSSFMFVSPKSRVSPQIHVTAVYISTRWNTGIGHSLWCEAIPILHLWNIHPTYKPASNTAYVRNLLCSPSVFEIYHYFKVISAKWNQIEILILIPNNFYSVGLVQLFFSFSELSSNCWSATSNFLVVAVVVQMLENLSMCSRAHTHTHTHTHSGRYTEVSYSAVLPLMDMALEITPI